MTAAAPDRPIPPRVEEDPAQPRLYLGVIVVEVIVVIALWMFGRYFSS